MTFSGYWAVTQCTGNIEILLFFLDFDSFIYISVRNGINTFVCWSRGQGSGLYRWGGEAVHLESVIPHTITF